MVERGESLRFALEPVPALRILPERYTLKLALGLSVSHDDDGKAADDAAVEFITDAQREHLETLIDETRTNIEKFCKLGGVSSLAEIRAVHFDNALRILMERKANMAGAS